MIKQWSQQPILTTPNSTTKLCVVDGSDPENMLLDVATLFSAYNESGGMELTKEDIENVLTGPITSHTHPQYLTAITKTMVEAVLIGMISSHSHDVSKIQNAVSQSDLATHASNDTHLTTEQKNLLNNLLLNGYNNTLTPEQEAVLNLLHVDGNNDMVVETNLIVEGAVTAFDFGPSSVVNYQMLTDWGLYNPTMTDWVVAAPLLYDMYVSVEELKLLVLEKVDLTRQVMAGLGLKGGGTLENDVTLSLDIDNLSYSMLETTDYFPVIKEDGIHYKVLMSDINSIVQVKNVFTISLPSANSVANRIAGAVEGVDYPTGWTLSVGASYTDLLITHNENKRVVNVTIFAVDGTQEQQLFNTAALNGVKTPDNNSVLIVSLATILKPIKIYLITT